MTKATKDEVYFKAYQWGLYIAEWSPGDGNTRYRFFTEDTLYDEGDGIYTALGLREAWVYLQGHIQGMKHAQGITVGKHERTTRPESRQNGYLDALHKIEK